jgi:hypothetical protein
VKTEYKTSLENYILTDKYNKIYTYQWNTSMDALPLSWIIQIDQIVTDKWGWHFVPNNGSTGTYTYSHQDQQLFITFESKEDLVLVKLCINN